MYIISLAFYLCLKLVAMEGNETWLSESVLGTKIQWEKLECNQWNILYPCLFSFFLLSGINVILEYNNWFLDESNMLSNVNDEWCFSNHLVEEQYLICSEVIICRTRTRLNADFPTATESGLIGSPICFLPKPGSSLISYQETDRAGKEIPSL